MKRAVWIALMAILCQSTAFADASADQMMDMMKNMQKQMSDMQQTIQAQSQRIQQLESGRVLETPQPSVPMQMSEADWQKGIKDNIGEAVPFLKGAKFAGDFRLRHEYFDYYDFDPAASTGTTQDRTRQRFRIRLRWGFEKDYGDDRKVGFRLAGATSTSGQALDNASTNITLGNPGYFTYKNIFIDRAYAIYSPNGLKDYGALKGLSIGAGKFDNPFLRYSTTIMWDSDVTPEGLYEKATFNLYSSEENKLNLYTNAGQFIINENSGIDTDAYMFGYQAALTWSTYNFNPDSVVDFTIAASYYDVDNFSRTITSNTTGGSFLRTYTSLMDEIGIMDIYPEIAFTVNNLPVTLWGNYVRNEDNTGAGEPITIHDQDEAHGFGVKIGKLRKKGDIEGFWGYYEIGANSVAAAFNDSDFGGPGGTGHTNRQGHKFGFSYQLAEAVVFNWTGYIVEPLNPTTVAANSTNETVFRSQADIVYKF